MNKLPTNAPANLCLPGHEDHEVACDACGLYGICRVAGLDTFDLEQLDEVVTRRDPAPRGQALFTEGEPFHAIYAIKSGSFKATTQLDGDTPHISGFYFTGELIGLDAIQPGRYPTTVTALEKSSVCRLEFDDLNKLDKRLPEFQQALITALSGQLSQLQANSAINQQIADRRLATFLLNLSLRFAKRGMPAEQFRLSMSRGDIGNYLGLAVETVSRLFSRFHDDGVLRVNNREVEILNLDALQQLTK